MMENKFTTTTTTSQTRTYMATQNHPRLQTISSRTWLLDSENSDSLKIRKKNTFRSLKQKNESLIDHTVIHNGCRCNSNSSDSCRWRQLGYFYRVSHLFFSLVSKCRTYLFKTSNVSFQNVKKQWLELHWWEQIWCLSQGTKMWFQDEEHCYRRIYGKWVVLGVLSGRSQEECCKSRLSMANSYGKRRVGSDAFMCIRRTHTWGVWRWTREGYVE